MKPTILVAGRVSREFYEILKPYAEFIEVRPEKMHEEIKKADILVVRSDLKVTRELLEKATG